jgi:hypothetical protein
VCFPYGQKNAYFRERTKPLAVGLFAVSPQKTNSLGAAL